MTPRERVLRAIQFDSPDRPPVKHNITGSAVIKHGQALLDILACRPDDYGTDTSFTELMTRRAEAGDGLDVDEVHTDAWGCVWRKRQDGVFGQVIEHPLADWSALDSYELPALPAMTDELVEQRRRAFDERKQAYFTYGGGAWLWEQMQLLRGDAAIMMDLMDGRPEVDALADRLFEHARRSFEPSLLAGCDGVDIGDDWGDQKQLRISPALWRQHFRPRYEALFAFVHGHGALVRFHSCGHVLEIIPDLIAIGADVINVQTSCMPLDGLAQAARGKVCLEVDIDRQYEMPHGSPADVRRRAQECYDALALREGGFVWLTEIGPDVPLENVAAYYEAAEAMHVSGHRAHRRQGAVDGAADTG